MDSLQLRWRIFNITNRFYPVTCISNHIYDKRRPFTLVFNFPNPAVDDMFRVKNILVEEYGVKDPVHRVFNKAREVHVYIGFG